MNVGYIRVSTERQHLKNQQDEIQRYADLNNIVIDMWVSEIISGKKNISGRKLGRLISKMKRGDTLIVSEVSRLSRTLTDIMTIMGKCSKKGINIHTTKEQYRFDDSINSKILCFAFGLVAEIERNLISMRTKEALALRKSEGKILGRRKGYTPKMDVLERNDKLIMKMLQDGKKTSEICARFKVSRDTYYKFLREHKKGAKIDPSGGGVEIMTKKEPKNVVFLKKSLEISPLILKFDP